MSPRLKVVCRLGLMLAIPLSGEVPLSGIAAVRNEKVLIIQ
jgi:hypothetical protein